MNANEQSDFKQVVADCHDLLTQNGIPECEAGTVCNNPNCYSKLYHRIHMLIEQRDKYISAEVGRIASGTV